MQKPVFCYIYKSRYDETSCECIESVNVSDERFGLGIGDEDMKEKGSTCKIDARDVKCTREHRKWEKKVIYEISDVVGSFGNQRRSCMPEQFICDLRHGYLVQPGFEDMVRSPEDRQKILR